MNIRKELQIKAVELIKNNDALALEWATGVGKSKAAIDIINYIPSIYEKPDVLLVVAELAHKENWKKEFLKWGIDGVGIVVETYASLKYHRGKHYNLMILDEAHHAASDLRLDILDDITCNKVLLLTATISQEVILQLSTIFKKVFATSKVTLRQAIEWGILPEPKIYLIPMQLDNTYRIHTVVETWGEDPKVSHQVNMPDRWKYMGDRRKFPNVNLTIKCTALEKYDFINSKVEYWKRMYMLKRQKFMENKWLQAGSERKRFLGDLKGSEVKALLAKIANKRLVCFCSSIHQADELGKSNSIHSKKKDSLSIIDSFNNKSINSLFAVGMIQEGQNLVGIEAGIIVQLDGQERAFIQKLGK